jgi:maltose O-acetyltransferase
MNQNRLLVAQPSELFWRLVYEAFAMHLPSWWRPAKKLRVYCAQRFCRDVAGSANINAKARLSPQTTIKPHGGVGERCILTGEVHIGSHVTMGPDCYLITGDHPVPPDGGRFRDLAPVHKPIRIEEDVFLGARVILLPGVTVGRGAAVGAGSVVAKDVPSGSVVVGNPARIVRSRKV